MLNRTMCLSMVLLSSSLLFTIPTATMTPLANNIKEEANVDIMVHKDRFGLGINPIQEQFEKDRIELGKKKDEKAKILLKEQQKNEPEWEEKTFIISYYGATYNECGNNKFITASGIPVKEGQVAVPKDIPFGSKLIINGIEYIATDRGNPNYIKTLSNGNIKVDVFIQRLSYETDYQYEKRINKLGVRKVVGKLLIKRSDNY